eukprot:superscaffoldBa00000662_g6412
MVLDSDKCNDELRGLSGQQRSVSIVLVENIPDDLTLLVDGRHHFPLSVGFHTLLDQAKHSVEVVSPVWDLNSWDLETMASTAKQGQLLFQRLLSLKSRGVKLKISSSVTNSAELKTLAAHNAEVHFVNMTAFTRGGLHSSFWIVDRKHIYIGSAAMDWRSLSKRKELGVMVYNCSCLGLDLHRVFSFYWQLHDRDYIPSIWSKRVTALYGKHNALELQLNATWATAYVSTSPELFCTKDRTRDVDAISQVIQSAKTFIFISVTDYLPLVSRSFRGTSVTRYWSPIDEVIREAVVVRGVRVRLLISFWKKTHPLTFNFVTSLKSLCMHLHNCSLEVVTTFVPNDGGVHLDFSELLDGVFLNDIMSQINPPSTPQGAKKVNRDPSQRIRNLNFLVQQIKTYYLCEKKEEYIERIQTLDFDTKAAIAVHIQELTHSQENVLDLQWLESSEVNPDELEAMARNMAMHLRHLLDQRDTHLETIAELTQEKEGVVSLLSSPSSPQSASYPPIMQQQQQAGTQQHLAVELADSKAKIRRLRQELEEKSEQTLDCRHELENMEAELKRIQQENSQLLVDARAARTYRDELDALRERAIKADKLESEVGRYREQLHKMEFYKAKVEELKEDNRVLQETKEVLEDQLAGWRARSDKIHQLEKHSLLLKARIHDMEQEREADRKRIEELQEENLALCLAQRRSMEESQHLGWELEQLSKTTGDSQGQQTLSEEVSERTRSRMLKLEKENRSLLRTIEDLRDASLNNSNQPKHSLRHEYDHVCQLSTVTEQTSNGVSECHQAEDLEDIQSEILLTDNSHLHIQEKGQLEDGDRGDHLKELMSDLEVLENHHNRRHCFVGSRDHSPGSKNSSPCHDSIFTGLPTRSSYASKHTQRLEAKCRALDTVNQHLQTSLDNTDRKVQRLEAEVQELEAENQSLQASLEELRISARRLEQLETEKQSLEQETTALEKEKRQLEKENRRLRQQTEIQEANLDSSNVCMASLEREMRFVVKEVEGLRETAERVKGLERDNRELTKQTAIDQRTLATLREVEKSTLNSQSASLMAQNVQLQHQQSGTEGERDSAIREREELRGAHEQLLRDHERLAALHERQAMEYETLMGKHGCLKNAHRTLELEHRTLQDRYNSLLQQRTKLEDLEKALKEEQMRMALEKEQHSTTAAECCRLRDEKDWLNQTYRQLLNDNELLTVDHKQLKSQLNEAKLEHTWLEADFSKLKKEYQQLDITSTKLTNQCELLSQLKGNLEEENRHLLTQIETLMLQNRTLLEQTMESKDLFHVEERQYIDKLNDLRRQKEKLEEKIMDQYKFYEPSPPRRRGNWITLKLKKLIKSSSREHGPERPPTPTHSGVTEPHISCHDNSSFISSDGSGGTSAGDAISPQRNSTLSSLAYPSAPFEDKQWAHSSEQLEEDRKDALTSSLTTSILSILHLHPTTPPSGHLQITATDTTETVPDVSELWVTDKDSNDSAVPSGFEDNDELQNHGLNVVQSRAQSESSGEFSLSLDNEPWSNGSSPVQQPQSRRSSSSYQPPCDTSTPQHTQKQQHTSSSAIHKEKASTMPITKSQNSDLQATPKKKEPGSAQDFWLMRGTKSIRRGSRGKVTRRSSDSGGTVRMSPVFNGIHSKSSPSKAETHRASICSPITVLYVQGKSSSMSGCLNCFSTPLGKEVRLKGPRSPKSLPRASSVISTAEGSSRRSSVNSDCRVAVKAEPLPAPVSEESSHQEQQETVNQNQQPDTKDKELESAPPVKPPRDPEIVVATDRPRSPVQEPLFGSSFTFNSVFSNTIFSDSVVTSTKSLDALENNQTFLCLNSSLVQNCPLVSQESAHNTSQTLLKVENEQSENAEHAAGLEEKDKPLTIA